MEMHTAEMDRASLIALGSQGLHNHVKLPQLTLRERLALCCGILHAHGHGSGLAGQVSARAQEPDSYWTQPMGLGLEEVCSETLLRVNADLEVLEGQGMANPATRFHSWIYRHLPQVQAIVHTHPVHTSALSMLGQPLRVAHMDSCMLFDDVGWLAHWPGVPIGNEEGRLIAQALGGRRAALLAHHGLVVAAQSIDEACVMAVQIERSARLQLLAQAAGQIRDIDADEARIAHDWILQPHRSAATFAYLARSLLRQCSTPQPRVREALGLA